MEGNKEAEVKEVKAPTITKIYTGKETKLPIPETTNEPDCPIALVSYSVFRSAMMKMFALSKSVNELKGRIEAYCLMLTNREDNVVTDIIIPQQTASGVSVNVDLESIQQVREELNRKNEGVADAKKRWRIVGWSHSHAGMPVFFSSTDWDNQNKLINAARLLVESGYQAEKVKCKGCGVINERPHKLIVIFGMTVNIREDIYAEVLNRMNCQSEVRQKGARLDVVEDVNKDDVAVQEKIYNDIEAEIRTKVSSPYEREYVAEKVRTKYIPITSYFETERKENVEQVSVDDVVKDIKSRVRSAGDVLFKAVKDIPVKKLLRAVANEDLATVLLNIVREARKIVIADVEQIVRGEEIEKEEEKELTHRKKKRYEKIVASIEAKTTQRSFESFGAFLKHIEGKIKRSDCTYVKSNPSFMNEKLEKRGFSFEGKATEQPTSEVVEKEKDKTPSDDIQSYFNFLMSEAKLDLKTAGDVRVQLYAGEKIETIADMKPKDLANLIGVTEGRAQYIIDRTRQYRKTIPPRPTPADETIEKIKEEVGKEIKERNAEIAEYVDYLATNVNAIYQSDKENITAHLKKGLDIQGILTMDNQELAKVLRSGSQTATKAKVTTLKYLISKNKTKLSPDFSYIYFLPLDAKTIKKLEEYIASEELILIELEEMTQEELAKIIECTAKEADDIKKTTTEKRRKITERFAPQKNEHHESDFKYFVEPLLIHTTTKEKMHAFLKDHSPRQFLSLKMHEIMKSFESTAWEANIVIAKFEAAKEKIKEAENRQTKEINGVMHYWSSAKTTWLDYAPAYDKTEKKDAPSNSDKPTEAKSQIDEFIEKVNADDTTKALIKAFLEKGNSMQVLADMSKEEAEDLFGCKPWCAKSAIEVATEMAKKPSDRSASPSDDTKTMYS